MAEDRIDSYVDRTGFNSDTEFVLGQLNTIYEAFKRLDNIKISLSKASGLGEAIPLMKQANEEFGKAADASKKLAEESAKAQLKITDSLKETIRQQLEYKKRLEEVGNELKKLKKDQEVFQGIAGNDEAKKEIQERILKLEEERSLLKVITGEIEKQVNEQAKRQVQVDTPDGGTRTLERLPIDEIRKLTAVQDDNIRSREELLIVSAKLKNENDLVRFEISQLTKQFDAGVISQEKYIQDLAELKDRQIAVGAATESVNRLLKNQEKQFQSSDGSTNALRAELNQLLQIFDSFTPEKQLSDVGQALKKRIDELTDSVTKQENTTGRFQRNVGNYANSLSGAFSKISDEISKLQAKQTTLQQQQAKNPIGFKFGGGEDDLNKTTAALNQLIQAQQIGFKVGANQTQQVRQLENAYIAFATSGTQSIEFLEAFKNEVGKVKDDVNDLKESIKLAASDTKSLDVLIGGAQAIAGGFGIAQGAAALFGDENEDLQKTLVKLNGVMTILNGLQAIQNELKKKDNILTIIQTNLQRAYTAVIGASTGALKVFRTALAATGIGVFLIAIGALVFAFDKIKAAMGGISKEQQRLIDQAEQRVEQEEKNRELLDSQDETLKRMGFSEEQITKNKIEQLKLNKQAKLDLLEIRRSTLQTQREAQQRSFRIVKTITDIVTLPILAISKLISKITGQKLPTVGDLLGKELFDPNKVDKEFQELEDQIKLETTQIQNQIDGLLNQQDEKRKQAAEKAGKEREKKLKELAELEERDRKARFELEKLDIESRLRLFQRGIDDELELERARAKGVSGEELKAIEQRVQQDRLNSLENFVLEKIRLAQKEADFEKSAKGLSATEIALIEKRKQDNITQILQDAIDKRLGLITKATAEETKLFKNVAASIEEAVKFGVDRANAAIGTNDKEQALIDEKKELYRKLYDDLSGLAFDFFTNSIDQQKNAIQEEIDLLEKRKLKEIEAIEQSALSSEEKADRIKIAEARTQAQREQLEQRQRQLDIQRARFEKLETIARIIQETALAIVSSFKRDPSGRLAILIGAVGAVQLARAISTQVPKFKGGKNLSKFQPLDNYEGPAIVGDGGKKEAIIREDGTTEVTPNTATLTHVRKNDIILPDVNMLTDRVIAKSLSKDYSINVHGELNIKDSINELKGEFRSGINRLNNTIKNKKELHVVIPGVKASMVRFTEENKEYLKMNGLKGW
jgi:hypothetical protein